MSKRHAFEALLQSELRWPTEWDMPFAEAAEPLDNALIADDGFSRLILMTDGYKRAADLMVEHTQIEPSSRDFLVFPVIFNYRHFLELSLKYQLAVYGPTVGIGANWRSHDLAELLAQFMDLLAQYGTADPDEADPAIQRIILEFAKIDPGSYSYRYPVDRNGRQVEVERQALDLANLADVMKAVESYFTGCDGYLDHLKGATP